MTARLHLLRHATTEDARPGHPDRDRRLTEQGTEQARAVGEHLRAAGLVADQLWLSPATRTRQTVTALGLDVEPVVQPGLYEAGVEEVLRLIAGCDPAVRDLLVVGHNPAMVGLAWELCPAEAPEQETLARRFPPASLVSLDLEGPWSDPGPATAITLRLP